MLCYLCYYAIINNNNVNSFMCTIIGAIFFLVMLFVLLCYVLWVLLLCFSGCYINDAIYAMYFAIIQPVHAGRNYSNYTQNNILLNSFDEF